MFIQVCLVLLALFSFAAASDPDCEKLIKPLEDCSKIYGKWIYYAGATDSESETKIIRRATSSWMEILPITGSDEYTFRYSDQINGKCHYGTGKSSTTGNLIKLTYYLKPGYHQSFGKHLQTCPDCHIWFAEEIKGGKKAKKIFFFTKTGQLDPSYLEDFKKQLKCLKISGEIYFPETTNLCPNQQEGAGKGMTKEPYV